MNHSLIDSVFNPLLPRGTQKKAAWNIPQSSALALTLVTTAEKHTGLIVAVTRDTHSAHVLEDELRFFADPSLPVLHLPDWETLPYDVFSPHVEIISQRVATLYRLPSITRGVLVLPIATLMQRLPPKNFIQGSNFEVSVGQTLDVVQERHRLDSAGYRHVPQVLEPGDYATRGALIDIFPMGVNEPYRIELFDQTVETIRTFDPETQRSQERVDSVRCLTAREFPITESATKNVRLIFRERFDIDPKRCSLYQDLREGSTPAGIEYYLPLFFDQTETLFDYLAQNSLFVLNDDAFNAAEIFWATTQERYEQRRHDVDRPILPPQEIFLPPQTLREHLNQRARIDVLNTTDTQLALFNPKVRSSPSLPLNSRDPDPGAALRAYLSSYSGRVLITTDSSGRREALAEQLRNLKIESTHTPSWKSFLNGHEQLSVTVATLNDGFILSQPNICILTEKNLLGERVTQARRRRRAARDPNTILRNLGELAEGAPVVHTDHGVGRYRGLLKLDIGGTPGEFLCIEYARGDKLYVPVSQLDLVNRYTGTAPELAPLHSLGGEAWDKAKRKAAERVRDVAAELLDIYAKREAREGNAINLDRSLYEQFASSFPFEETPDQLQAIEAVLADLQRLKPMDRVVCGDVGFGKTEVAVRAAFAVAHAGKQVALLVPTTLLAQQHYRNFCDRFADWPVRIDLLSRFRSTKEISGAINKIASGEVDIVIGTHKLLQNDIRFKDLGLVIVDEEHRFGVRHKEQFKKLRAEVDCLTLTATPIPRTLNMSMAGLRDLSIIATPPAHRLAVQTFITPWDVALIREAFLRELSRGGQVYFLHNEVDTIEKMARELEALLPDARIRYAHGQMPERELEAVMLDFYRHRFNVLVSTTIIESGIDVPTANTIIINRADRFGLAQLHQLRGRVGRSHHRAYAYLIVPDRKTMTADAEKRLDAIASLEELGAGFALATHDLEIRGAGELLGEGQSGQIQEVGFTIYTELLDRAVRALKDGKVPAWDDADTQHTEIELHIPALIPDDYLPDIHARLVLYKRIAGAPDCETLRDLQIELVDRFGPLPEASKNLFALTELKQKAKALGIRKLDFGPQGGRITFFAKPNIDPLTVIKMVQELPKVYALDGQDKLKIRLALPGAQERIRTASEIIAALSKPSTAT
jgi:transcription-repair coupling factor (superfamily II helicase)